MKRKRRLTYWIAERLGDSSAYSVRARTRRECVRLLTVLRPDATEREADFGRPRKVTIEYENAFDLMLRLTGEGGGEG